MYTTIYCQHNTTLSERKAFTNHHALIRYYNSFLNSKLYISKKIDKILKYDELNVQFGMQKAIIANIPEKPFLRNYRRRYIYCLWYNAKSNIYLNIDI